MAQIIFLQNILKILLQTHIELPARLHTHMILPTHAQWIQSSHISRFYANYHELQTIHTVSELPGNHDMQGDVNSAKLRHMSTIP